MSWVQSSQRFCFLRLFFSRQEQFFIQKSIFRKFPKSFFCIKYVVGIISFHLRSHRIKSVHYFWRYCIDHFVFRGAVFPVKASCPKRPEVLGAYMKKLYRSIIFSSRVFIAFGDVMNSKWYNISEEILICTCIW